MGVNFNMDKWILPCFQSLYSPGKKLFLFPNVYLLKPLVKVSSGEGRKFLAIFTWFQNIFS